MAGADALTLLGVFNPRELGAGGDGIMDDAVGIKAAIGGANQVGGGIVWIPPGTYRLASSPSFSGASNVSVLVAPGVSFTGSGSMPAASGSNGYFGLGALPATLGYNLTGTKPTTAATGVDAGTFFSVTAPNGGNATVGAPGAGGSISETTGNAGTGGSGNANGGDINWTLGTGSGTGRNGRFNITIPSDATTTWNVANTPFRVNQYGVGVGFDPFHGTALGYSVTYPDPILTSGQSVKGLNGSMTITLTGNNTTSPQGMNPSAYLVDGGFNLTGTLMAMDMETHVQSPSSGTHTQILAIGAGAYIDNGASAGATTLQGVDFYANNSGSGLVASGYGGIFHIDVTSTASGATAITAARAVSAYISNASTSGALINNSITFNAQSPTLTNSGSITTVTAFLAAVQYNTVGNTSTTGGYAAYGFKGVTPNQGGNTSGTDTNAGFYIDGTGGAAGALGTVNNYAGYVTVPSAAAVATAIVTNYGFRITGNGGGGAGTITNYALFSDSTAASYFAGGVGFNTQVNMGGAASSVYADAVLSFHGNGIASAGNAYAIESQLTLPAGTTGSGYGAYMAIRTAAAAFTMVNGYVFYADTPIIGAASAITNLRGVTVANQFAAGVTNVAGVVIVAQSGATAQTNLLLGTATIPAGTWNIYASSASNNSLLGSLAIGSNTAAVGTGALAVEGVLARYNAVATAGYGVHVIRATGRPATQTNTTVTITSYANPATDASYEIRVNVNVTVSTTVTMTVTCTYTDEANVARTLTIPFLLLAGTLVQSITTAQGNIAYESVPITIRAKASTTISLQTAGTVTAVTYTTEGRIVQVA